MIRSIQAHRKREYPEGSRVEVTAWQVEGMDWDEVGNVPLGTLGTVDYHGTDGTVFVEWDNGVYLGALLTDVIKRVP